MLREIILLYTLLVAGPIFVVALLEGWTRSARRRKRDRGSKDAVTPWRERAF